MIMFGYGYMHSKIGSDGKDYITFMIEPEVVDSHGMRWARAVDITNDYKKNTAQISTFRWVQGVPSDWKIIKVLKEETVSDSEVPALMEKLGIVIK